MFQGLLEKLLERVIGEYVDIDSKNLNMSVYSGVIDLHDLYLKKTVLKQMNLPLDMVLGRIKKLYVRVPWNALSSRPVQLEIYGLNVLVKPLPRSEGKDNTFWTKFVEEQNSFENVEKKLINYAI